jgi:hypothetical protein
MHEGQPQLCVVNVEFVAVSTQARFAEMLVEITGRSCPPHYPELDRVQRDKIHRPLEAVTFY